MEEFWWQASHPANGAGCSPVTKTSEIPIGFKCDMFIRGEESRNEPKFTEEAGS